MNKTTRDSNFELLRIVCMIMIITTHTVLHGGAMNALPPESINFLLANFLRSLSVVAVNCYVLISGYYGISSEFKLKKLINLYAQILFYSIIISSLFWITGIQEITLEGIINMMFPIFTKQWWFMSVFLILYILSPYINKLLKSLTLKEFKILLLILIVIFSIWPSIPFFQPIDITHGYSINNFILLYIIGAYISIFLKNKSFGKYYLVGYIYFIQ